MWIHIAKNYMIFHNFDCWWTSANSVNEISSRKIFQGNCSCGKDKFRPKTNFSMTRFQNSIFFDNICSKSTIFEGFLLTILQKHLLRCFRKMQFIFQKKGVSANFHQNFVTDRLLQFVLDSIHLSRVVLSRLILDKMIEKWNN